MGYDIALGKAWAALAGKKDTTSYAVRFLNDTYDISVSEKKILSRSCNVPPKQAICLLILHYLIRSLDGLPALAGKWITFRQLAGGEGYYPAFKARAIDPLARKYGDKPEALLDLSDRVPAKRTRVAETSVVMEAFDAVPVLIALWHGDEEFGPELNILFDKSISSVFCTEDVAVLAEIIARTV